MIYFRKVKYRNFLSSGDQFTEVQLDSSKTTLVVGQNGAGKSTMLDAISFALFGRAHRNINKPQLVNSINNKQCLVEVEFDVGRNHYKVVRGIKPVKFEIYSNNTLMNQNSHNKEYQKVLEQNILKLTHKTFHQVVVLGSSSFTPFMQLSSMQRRDVIEDLLDIGVFSKMNMLLKEKIAVLKERINQTEHQIEINDTKTDSQKKYIRDISRINEDARQQKESSIEESQKEIEELVLSSSESQESSAALESEYRPLLEKEKDDSLKLSGFKTDIDSKIRALVKEAKFYEKNETCPTCEQDIEDSLKQSKLSMAQSKANELQNGLAEVEDAIKSSNERREDLSIHLEKALELSQSVMINNRQIETLRKTIDTTRAEIELLSNSESDLAKANEDFDKLKSEFYSLNGDLSNFRDQYSYHSVISEMLKDTGIKTKIIKQYLPVMNTLVNQYLQILDFYVHFDLDESFTETIRSRHRDAFSYDSFSEGEKQRIDLSLLFTWRQIARMKNSISTNLLMLDETFDSSLDESGIENLIKIIHTLGEDTNVFIISHKGEILDGKFENKIEFVKDKNFSKMKVAA
jgi:DNA repair exonuclease SbcCD ATPase subunit